MKSSNELYNVYILEFLIKQIINLDESKKQYFWNKYKNELMQAYFNFKNIDVILNYIFKKLHKIVNHSRNLFDYYWKENNIDEIYNLNENVKIQIIKGNKKYINRTV